MGLIDSPASYEAPVALDHTEAVPAHAFRENHVKLSLMATPVGHPRKLDSLDDRELARLASAGDGHAFARLYDRHERRVYGFCMRMLSSPHDAADATQETFVRLLGRLPALQGRELNFAAYALAAARNACYDMIEGRRRVEPVAEQPNGSGFDQYSPPDASLERDPERAALLASTREDVRAANAELPARQREVLALREVELLSYDEIGELMGLNRNAVAQLVSRARIKLRDLLRGSALASVSAASEDCAKALPLLASLQDKQRDDLAGLDWVQTHLAACETCRVSQAAMQEAGMSYRALAPIAPLLWLRHATIARAAEFVGADWSNIASTSSAAHGPVDGQPSPRDSPSGARGPDESAGEHIDQRTESLSRDTTRLRARLARWIVAVGTLLTLCLLLLVMASITRDGHVSSQALPAADAPTDLATTTPVRARQAHHAISVPVGAKLVQSPALHGPVYPATVLATLPASKSRHRSRRVSSRRRHPLKPATHRTTPPAATTPSPSAPAPTPATTPGPAAPAPSPTTTTPPTQTTPAPIPPTTTGTGETTETTPAPAPREKPGLIP